MYNGVHHAGKISFLSVVCPFWREGKDVNEKKDWFALGAVDFDCDIAFTNAAGFINGWS